MLARLPALMFLVSLLFAAVVYGIFAQIYGLFPEPQLHAVAVALQRVFGEDKYLFFPAPESGDSPTRTIYPDKLSPGLVFVQGVNAKRQIFARVMDRDGTVVHEWRPDWFKVWGSEGAFPDDVRPKQKPGVILMGAQILPSGDLVANFHGLSTFRMDPCGNVVWKLQNYGHHSLELTDDGAMWVGAERGYEEGTRYPNYAADSDYWVLQKISLDGTILRNIDVLDVLHKNGLEGLMYLSTTSDKYTAVFGDTMHLNDVEAYPSGWPSQVFSPGDIMFSLRNINSVLVIDPETLQIKFRTTGRVLRQHDPDFMPGDRISIFDNHNLTPDLSFADSASRVVEIDARTGALRDILDGAGPTYFFSQRAGSHQRLPNGNILVQSESGGRVMEFLPDGRLAWSWNNRISLTKNAIVNGAQILPPQMNRAFFKTLDATCA
jgi:hypothetical protein